MQINDNGIIDSAKDLTSSNCGSVSIPEWIVNDYENY